MYISPNDYPRFKQGGWVKMQEPTQEQIKKYNESARLKRESKLEKGGSDDVK